MSKIYILGILFCQAFGQSDQVAEEVVPPEGETPAEDGPSFADPAATPGIVAPSPGPAARNLAEKWTYDAIMAKVNSNGEGESKDRFKLQNALEAAAPEQTKAVADFMPNVVRSKADVFKWGRKVDNVTQFLHADATAGGLVATSRSLMQELPQTQKLLSKTMATQLKNLAQDTLVIKKTITETDSDYRERIQATADTVQAMFSSQDKTFASMASQQAAAMQQTAGSLNVTASRAINAENSDAKAAVNTAVKVTTNASTGVKLSSSALSDAADTLGEVQSEFKSDLQSTTRDLDANLNGLQDKSVDKLGKSSEKTLTKLDEAAMTAGRDLSRSLSQTDSVNSRLLNGVMKTVATGAATIGKTVDKSTAATTKLIAQTGSTIDGQIGQVEKKSALSMGDVLQLITDAKAMLSKQSATSSAVSSGYDTDIGKLIPLMNGKFSSVTNQAKSVATDLTSGASGEMLHLNEVIASLVAQSGSQSGDLSTRMGSLLAASQKAQAARLAQTQGGIGGQSNQLQAAMALVSKSGVSRAGDLTNKANSMGSALGGSIADLMAVISETTGNGKADLAAITSGLGGQASDTYTNLIESLRGLNQESTDSKEAFVGKFIGPSSDSAKQSFGSMQTFLANLLGSADGLAGGQSEAMAKLRAMQGSNKNQVLAILQSMKGIDGLNRELGSAVGAQGAQLLAAAKNKMSEDLRASLLALTGQTSESMQTVDNLINGQTSPASSATMDAVAKSLSLSSANIDSISRDFSNADKAQLKSLSGLSAMAISVLGQTSNQGGVDKQQTEAALANARANIVGKFREIAANSTNTEVSQAMLALAKSGNDTAIIQYLLADVGNAMAQIDKDAAIARDVNDRKKAQFQTYVDAQQAELQKQQAAIVAQLDATISAVQGQLQNKTLMLNGTRAEMEATLDEIRSKVLAAQETLGQNLQLYQAKLDGIIGEIRSYMNLSADADDLAIRKDIGNQLAKINGTQVAIASANAAVADKLMQQRASQNQAGSSSFQVVSDVIGSAIAMEGGATQGHLSNEDGLISVTAGVDIATGELNGKLGASAALMENGIANSKATASKTVQRAEANGAKVIDQLNQKSIDVASQSRKAYIRNLEKMGLVDDDTAMVSKQLASLLSNSDSTIADVSSSVMSHLDLSSKTLAALNSAEARKVASVSDVMGAFTSVVLSFLNETGSTMATVMSQLNAVEDGSKVKLGQMDTRSRDELNWVDSNLNATSDAYKLFMDQERAIQDALRTGVQNVQTKLQVAAQSDDQLSDINDAMEGMRQSVGKAQADELSKVRSWINDRDPEVAKRILKSSSSFLETDDSSAIVGDIRNRLRAVKQDMLALEAE